VEVDVQPQAGIEPLHEVIVPVSAWATLADECPALPVFRLMGPGVA
jgi:hypothetical protein